MSLRELIKSHPELILDGHRMKNALKDIYSGTIWKKNLMIITYDCLHIRQEILRKDLNLQTECSRWMLRMEEEYCIRKHETNKVIKEWCTIFDPEIQVLVQKAAEEEKFQSDTVRRGVQQVKLLTAAGHIQEAMEVLEELRRTGLPENELTGLEELIQDSLLERMVRQTKQHIARGEYAEAREVLETLEKQVPAGKLVSLLSQETIDMIFQPEIQSCREQLRMLNLEEAEKAIGRLEETPVAMTTIEGLREDLLQGFIQRDIKRVRDLIDFRCFSGARQAIQDMKDRGIPGNVVAKAQEEMENNPLYQSMNRIPQEIAAGRIVEAWSILRNLQAHGVPPDELKEVEKQLKSNDEQKDADQMEMALNAGNGYRAARILEEMRSKRIRREVLEESEELLRSFLRTNRQTHGENTRRADMEFARAGRNDYYRKMTTVERILQYCPYHEPSMQWLRVTSPQPQIKNCKMYEGEDSRHVVITWEDNDRTVSYEVRRCRGHYPEDIADGESIGKPSGRKRWEDILPTDSVGVPWYYVIFGIRTLDGAWYRVECPGFAVWLPPPRKAEVQVLLEDRGKSIQISWEKPPEGCRGVRIQRLHKKGLQVKVTDLVKCSGEDLEIQQKQQFVDRQLEPGSEYQYVLTQEWILKGNLYSSSRFETDMIRV